MKTAEKTQPTPREDVGQSREELQTAYQVHTLAHMLYGQLAMTHPWMAAPPPVRGIDPMAGHQAAPWGHYAPPMWGYPQRWGW